MISFKFIILILLIPLLMSAASSKKIAYLTSDLNIPFWDIMAKGIIQKAKELGYDVNIYSANNIKKTELKNIVNALTLKPDGLIISPINSSTAATILKFANNSHIPVVVSDVGADSGTYISYISSDNRDGGYDIGKVLVKEMKKFGWDRQGSVGIIAIPQKRDNGKARTEGFLKALNEANIRTANIKQQVDFSYKETYDFSIALIKENPSLRAIWLQGSNKYKGALDAINDMNKQKDILLICFDAEPIFLELIPKGIIVGSAMQQPYLMGQKAVETLDNYLNGKKVEKEQVLPILAISKDNIENELEIIKRYVLGIEKNSSGNE